MEMVMTNGFAELSATAMEMVEGGASAGVSALRFFGGAALLCLVGGCAMLSAPVAAPLLLVDAGVSGVAMGSSSWAY